MNDGSRILVVDDEPSICWALEKSLAKEGYQVATASSAEEGLRHCNRQSPELVMLDVRMPGEDGISALPKFLAATDDAPIIVMTAFGDLETAVAAVKQGASDYLTKPFGLSDASKACAQALSRSSKRSVIDAEPKTPIARNQTLVGSSAAMQLVFRQIALVAESNLSVLITGETGTGKELVAAALHRHSDRADNPYVAIAPVALNPELIESELFGHVQGAFTGATSDRAGLFERAKGGTILLDEIGDLPLATQPKLLRVLEQGEYCRVGDSEVRTADVRVIAATNCDLHDAIIEGRFREDLFHRLSGMQIHLPPLRNRPDDMLELCHHFLSQLDYSDFDNAIDADLLKQLQARRWQGNVRELKNAVEHAAVVARGRRLSLDDFPVPTSSRDSNADPNDLSIAVEHWADAQFGLSDQSCDLHARFLSAAEPTLLRMVLEHTGGNRANAAELLGIHRGTLRDRLKAYGLSD